MLCVDLVKNIPDASIQEDNENNALAESNVDFGCIREEPGTPVEPRPPPKEKRKSLSGACKYNYLQGGAMQRFNTENEQKFAYFYMEHPVYCFIADIFHEQGNIQDI